MHQPHVIHSNLQKTEEYLEKATAGIGNLTDILNRPRAIRFYAQAHFEAEERTCWVISVYLDIEGNNGLHLTLNPETICVFNAPRLSYNNWKQQRDQDRPKAQKELERTAAKWGCTVMPIAE